MWNTKVAKSKNTKLGNPKTIFLVQPLFGSFTICITMLPSTTQKDYDKGGPSALVQNFKQVLSFCYFSPHSSHILFEARGLWEILWP